MIYLFIKSLKISLPYLLTVLYLHCWAGFSLAAASKGYSIIAVLRLLIAVASLVGEPGLGSVSFGFRALEHMINSCGVWV